MNKYILPTFLILLSIGLFAFYIDPTYKEIKDLKEANIQYSEARNKSKELRVARDELLEKYNSFSDENLARIKKLLPDNVDNVRLVMDIDNIAFKYGTTVKSVQIETSDNIQGGGQAIVSNKKDYDFVTVSFSIEATYSDFISFVSDLKNSLRLVDITHVDFGTKRENSDFYKFNISLKTYWLK